RASPYIVSSREQLRAAIAFWWRVYPLPIFSSPLGSNIFGTHTDLHQQHPAKNKPIWRTGISRTQPSLGFYDCKDLHFGFRFGGVSDLAEKILSTEFGWGSSRARGL